MTHAELHEVLRSGATIVAANYRGSIESNGVRTHQHECPECRSMLAFEAPQGTHGYDMDLPDPRRKATTP